MGVGEEGEEESAGGLFFNEESDCEWRSAMRPDEDAFETLRSKKGSYQGIRRTEPETI